MAITNDFQPTRTLVYRRIGAVELALHVFEPPGWQPGQRNSAIVYFHGGAWKHGDPSAHYGEARYLAARGMVAFSAQYRLTPSGVKVAGCIEDAKAALRFVRTHASDLGVAPDKIAAGGASAGGHLAAACAVLPDAGPIRDGVSARPDLLVLTCPAFFHKLAEGTLAPEHFMRDTPPAILFLGSADEMLAYARTCLERSRREGNLVELHVAEGGAHTFATQGPWRERTIELTDRFLARHGFLQGEPAIEPPQGSEMPRAK